MNTRRVGGRTRVKLRRAIELQNPSQDTELSYSFLPSWSYLTTSPHPRTSVLLSSSLTSLITSSLHLDTQRWSLTKNYQSWKLSYRKLSSLLYCREVQPAFDELGRLGARQRL